MSLQVRLTGATVGFASAMKKAKSRMAVKNFFMFMIRIEVSSKVKIWR